MESGNIQIQKSQALKILKARSLIFKALFSYIFKYFLHTEKRRILFFDFVYGEY